MIERGERVVLPPARRDEIGDELADEIARRQAPGQTTRQQILLPATAGLVESFVSCCALVRQDLDDGVEGEVERRTL